MTLSGRPSLFNGKKNSQKSEAAVIISINTSQSQTSFFSADKGGVPPSGKQSILGRPLMLGDRGMNFSEVNLPDSFSGGPVIR
jgi:hypothetical protein